MPKILATSTSGGIEIASRTLVHDASSTPVSVSTEEAMTALLVAENVGKAFKYTGTSGTYINGDIYVVEDTE